MKNRLWFPFITAMVIVHGCDVFLPDIGREGEPCSAEGNCVGDLVCNFYWCTSPLDSGAACSAEGNCAADLVCNLSTCMPPPSEGKACNIKSSIYTDVCDVSMLCLDGACTRVGEEGERCIPSPLCYLKNGEDVYCDDRLSSCGTSLECREDICVPVTS